MTIERKIYNKRIITLFIYLVSITILSAQTPKPPVMGWSSWNNFRIHIDEEIIRQQADIMKSSGMYEAGYRFVNIDDGFFEGRAADGSLLTDTVKFPAGMKSLADYIHSKGLKAGIYSDAGNNTCGSIWDNDKKGVGVGMYGHVQQDADLFFKQWGYDFIKVDWCGGEKMELDEEETYTEIIKTIKNINPDVVFNICRWEFPGEWAIQQADSWRISRDIDNHWGSICRIIDINANLGKYASPGHYNDMDMLQVGRGMTYEEDKAHFSMWCMLASPLLAGNDLRDMTEQTLGILTNKHLIAINQDPNGVQAERISKLDDVEVWVKPITSADRNVQAIAYLNRGESKAQVKIDPKELKLNKSARVHDLWLDQDLGKIGKGLSVEVPSHGIVVLKVVDKKA